MSWLRFLCLSVWEGWRHLLGTQVAYGHIYIRNRFRCTSPVCNRRDVTPHHIQFRSAGGSDEDHNLTSPCTWCHLHGIHGGRIRATGKADHIRWELGPRNAPPSSCTDVSGWRRDAVESACERERLRVPPRRHSAIPSVTGQVAKPPTFTFETGRQSATMKRLARL